MIDRLYVQEEAKPQLGIMGIPANVKNPYLAQVLEEFTP